MNIRTETPLDWLPAKRTPELPGEQLGWLQKQRKQGLEDFSKLGLPGVRDEEWRYTNLRALKNNPYAFATADSNVEVQLAETKNPRMVFVNGFYRSELSTLEEVPDQIQFASMDEVLNHRAELVEPVFGQGLPKQQHGFTALNTAYCQDGYVLFLPDNMVFKGVLEVCFIANTESQETDCPMIHNRNQIISGVNSQCTVIERYIGGDGDVYLNNTVTEIHAGENSHIDHYKLHQESAEAFHVGGVFIKQAANSQVKNHNFALSGLVVRNDIKCDLLGSGAHIEMNGLVLGSGRQHIDNHTEVNHAVPNCSSNEYYKTILDDQSRSVFRGRIIVAQDAQQTAADQQNNNLLLSPLAEADSKPQLEIYADDVQCSHGATVGQLDPKSLFYLRSRGIDLKSATALLTFAFANQVVERIMVETVRNELTKFIAGELLSGLEELI